MRLWKRASGALKDQSSLWQANLTRRTALRNPDIEKAVIRATSHVDSSLDRRDLDRVCQWLRLSPLNLKPILWSVSHRLELTSSWVVALKGLCLMHLLLNSRDSGVRGIGRLPFDLSSFRDCHSRQSRAWPFNALVRAYYAFLDHKSAVVFRQAEDEREEFALMRELALLQKLQGLIDLSMQIKPASRAVYAPLVLHVMDGVVMEIYDIYSRLCRGIVTVLMNIYSAGKAEATAALDIVHKASRQGEDLVYYLEFCHEIGVAIASEFPFLDRIPDEGIHELEQIIGGFNPDRSIVVDELRDQCEEKAIVVREVGKKSNINEGKNFYEFRTIITDNWEKFDEDFVAKNPFGSPVKAYAHGNKNQELPDLMTFL